MFIWVSSRTVKNMQKWTHSKRCVRDRGATVGSPVLPSTSHRLPPCTAPPHRDDYSPDASTPIRSGWQHSLCTAQAVFPLCLRRKGIRPPIVGRAAFLQESTGKPRSLIDWWNALRRVRLAGTSSGVHHWPARAQMHSRLGRSLRLERKEVIDAYWHAK